MNDSSVDKYVKDEVDVIIYDSLGWDVEIDVDDKIDIKIGGVVDSGV